jgi:hypothetical protein
MSRSGNHAVINWILSQAEGRTCFLNCAEPGINPFESARPLSADQPGHLANFDDFEIEAERRGRLSRKDVLIHSYEDTFLGPLGKGRNEAMLAAAVGTSRRRIDLLILRDPRNLFASRLASGYGRLDDDLVTRVWCQHAREYLGLRRNLRQERLMLSYNAWATSHDYRRRVSAALGMRFDDRAAHVVPHVAGGSSFDGTTFDGRAEAMPVLTRWGAFRGDPRFERMLTPTVLELAGRAFGPVPAALPLAAAA